MIKRIAQASLIVSLICTSACLGREKLKILISMTTAQKNFFIREIVAPFEAKNKVKVKVISTMAIDSIEGLLKKYDGEISLVKIPFIKSWSLVRNGYISSLNEHLSDDDLEGFARTYILTRFGDRKGFQFFLPRKYETRIMVYRKSRVQAACNVWESYKGEINAMLKEVNGFGLPRNYALERRPDLWDYFDVFVAGYIWAREPYNGLKSGRVAHRAKKYSGTALRIIDRVYQCSGDSLDMLRMDGDPVVDAFAWEAAYAHAGIYNPRMIKEEWSGMDIWKGFGSEDVFLSFMTQIDCFYLFGTGSDGLVGYIDDTTDIGVSLMPSGCSLQLDSIGTVLRKGSKGITTGGWWWALPKKCPQPQLAYALFTHMTSRTNQLQECMRFGMIPVRQDILKDRTILFSKSWKSKVFRTSYKQVQKNDANILPSIPNFDKIVDIYTEAWFDIVAGKNWAKEEGPPDRAYINELISESYTRKANKYLRR